MKIFIFFNLIFLSGYIRSSNVLLGDKYNGVNDINKIKIDHRRLENNSDIMNKIEGEEKTEEMEVVKIEQKEIEEDKKKCNFDFKSRFVKSISSDFELNGIEATEEIKKFCPSIERSCCSVKEIEYLFEQIALGKKNFLDKSLDFLKEVIIRLENLQENKIENFIREKEDKILVCLGDTPKDKLREFFFKLKKSAPIIMDSYKNYMYESFLTQFKLQCGICDLKNSDFFEITTVEEIKKNPITVPPYKLHVKMPDEIFEFYKNFEFYELIENFEKLSNFYECVYDEEVNTFDFNKQLYPSEVHEFIKNGDKNGLEQNEAALKFFRLNYIPGGTRDIIFKHIIVMLENMFFEGRTKINNKILNYFFWVPLENNNKSDPEFGYGKVNIITQSEGYSSLDNDISNNQFIKELENLKVKELSQIFNIFFIMSLILLFN